MLGGGWAWGMGAEQVNWGRARLDNETNKMPSTNQNGPSSTTRLYSDLYYCQFHVTKPSSKVNNETTILDGMNQTDGEDSTTTPYSELQYCQSSRNAIAK